MVGKKSKPIVLTIAGSDPTGGAGVQADLEAISTMGGRGVCAITAITAQDEDLVLAIHPTPADILSQQLAAAVRLNIPRAIKVGMVATLGNVKLLSWFLGQYPDIPIVIDPVLHSSSGFPLLDKDAINQYRQTLLPLATVITPNIMEAQVLAGQQIMSVKTMETAAATIHEDVRKMRGKISKPLAIIVKGGHLEGDEVVDVLYDGEGWRYFSGKRIPGKSPRGTGCRFAAALATALAKESPMISAIEDVRIYLREYISSGKKA